MMTSMKLRKVVFVAVWNAVVVSFACGDLCASEPVIEGWSSEGGRTRNKDNNRDIMYLVQPGDRVRFRVTARSATQYKWQVNKQVQRHATGASFSWTVPVQKAIWEIHVVVSNSEGEAHHEWVVSTLPADEAPDVFDYFCDAKYCERDQSDPWGRPLPDWYVVSDLAKPVAERCHLQPPLVGPPDDEGNINATLYLPSETAFGTWTFWYLLPGDRYDGRGGWTHLRLCFVNPRDPTLPPFWYTRSMDAHNYTGLGHLNRIDHDMGWSPPRKLWQEVKIIRTPQGDLLTWVDGVFQFRGRELRGKEAASLSIKLAHYRPDRNPEGTIVFDSLEVYHNRYLFPPKSVRYGQYIHDWAWGRRKPEEVERWFDFRDNYALFLVPPRPVALRLTREPLERWGYTLYLPVLKEGIVIEGRAVRLADIAASIGDRGFFQYNEATRTAICRANLVVSEGSELVLDGETLKFDCRYDGELEFAVMFGATLKARKSTITTTGPHHFNWRLAGVTHFGYHAGPLHNPLYTGVSYVSDLWYHGLCTLLMHKTTVDNCGYLFISSPMQIDIVDCVFSNLHEVDTADYERVFGRRDYPAGAAKGIKNRFKGQKGLWIGLFGAQMLGFNFRNVQITGHRSPIDFCFLGNDPDYGAVRLYDVEARNENLAVRQGFRIRGYHRPEPCPSTIELVNCRFRRIAVPSENAAALVKYYLNVEVVDSEGKPVPEATVKVKAEASAAQALAEREDDLWIVTDCIQTKDGKKEFTYSVEAKTPDGRQGRTTGLDPDHSWYRHKGRQSAVTVKVTVP